MKRSPERIAWELLQHYLADIGGENAQYKDLTKSERRIVRSTRNFQSLKAWVYGRDEEKK